MAWPIVVLMAILATAFSAVAQAPRSDAQEGDILRFDKKYRDLPPEYRKPVELAFAYDRTHDPDSGWTIDNMFTMGLIDLNGDGILEVAIRVENALHGMIPNATVLIARKTAAGWRYIGRIEAPVASEHELIPPHLAELTQIYVENRTVDGWRVINNGPDWKYHGSKSSPTVETPPLSSIVYPPVVLGGKLPCSAPRLPNGPTSRPNAPGLAWTSS